MRNRGSISGWSLCGWFGAAFVAALLASGCGDDDGGLGPGDDDLVPGRIVFETYREGNGEIYVMDADGTHVMQLTSSAGPNWEPTVSIDGTRIAFTTERHDPGHSSEVYTVKIDGTGETRLTTTSTWNLEPSWPGQ